MGDKELILKIYVKDIDNGDSTSITFENVASEKYQKTANSILRNLLYFLQTYIDGGEDDDQ